MNKYVFYIGLVFVLYLIYIPSLTCYSEKFKYKEQEKVGKKNTAVEASKTSWSMKNDAMSDTKYSKEYCWQYAIVCKEKIYM